MIFREITEIMEENHLSPFATKSTQTKGRKISEEECMIRTEYQRDRDRILHSKAFRRLKHKTQVFLSPEGDHYRTRLTHTLEVAQIGRTIARALKLNEDLTEAIALGHDIGHTPFGHSGEKILNITHKKGFKHNEHSLRVVDYLERGKLGYGLNLTYEVRDGILNHTGEKQPITLEGQVVRISDRIAYINHDIDDAIRAKILRFNDIPKDCLNILGKNHSERINRMIVDVIKNSYDKRKIRMSEEKWVYTNKLRKFMFANVYLDKKAKKEEDKAQYIVEQLYHYFLKNQYNIPEEIRKQVDLFGLEETVKDYIAGMSDRYAINKYLEIYVPSAWK
ncbi:MAG: deoxyguanosinetriphosphate triphosphohydrolase [Marinisporobacter sp.]|nr:deoxyguanosinetriphosphate triphosphohydrolase [Marinisporobacter sp.]